MGETDTRSSSRLWRPEGRDLNSTPSSDTVHTDVSSPLLVIRIELGADSPPCAVFFQEMVYLPPKFWLAGFLLLGGGSFSYRTHPALMSKVMTNSAAIGGSSRATRQLVLARSTCRLPFSLMTEGGREGGRGCFGEGGWGVGIWVVVDTEERSGVVVVEEVEEEEGDVM